jgi:hypothetical protein
MPAQICFRDHVGLPGQPSPPTIDGYVEPEDFVETGFGTTVSETDPGWTGAARITYVADTSVGAGRPLTVFQGLKDNAQDYIYLSFVVRRDTEFHDQDAIVLVLRPAFPNPNDPKDGSERRIDIFPNSQGIGAGTAVNHENVDPRNVEYYSWDTTGSLWQNLGANAVNNVTIKCRSWDLGNNNKNWSIEVQLPASIALGGSDWIDLTGNFGFYFNVIRLCDGVECSFDPTPFSGGSFQFTWPRADYGTGTGLIQGVIALQDADIPLAWLGEAILGDGPACSGVAGVGFENGSSSSIGVLSGATIVNQIDADDPNTFVARVVNTASTNADQVQATFRIANWGVGPGDVNKWNLVPPTGGTANPSIPPTTIPSGGAPVDLTMEWQLSAAEQAMYGNGKALDDHQCIWVLLDSVQAVDFTQSSIRRNMNFVDLSEQEKTAEISGDGYPPPPDGAADQEMILIVSQMRRGRLVRTEHAGSAAQRNRERGAQGRAFAAGEAYRDPSGPLGFLWAWLQVLFSGVKVVYEWVWVMDGYRRTEYELGLGEKRYRIYEPVGAFGYLADHEGLASGWSQSVTPGPEDADKFSRSGTDAYRLLVPNGGKAHIKTRLEAREYRLPWWLWVILLALILAILALLW